MSIIIEMSNFAENLKLEGIISTKDLNVKERNRIVNFPLKSEFVSGIKSIDKR